MKKRIKIKISNKNHSKLSKIILPLVLSDLEMNGRSLKNMVIDLSEPDYAEILKKSDEKTFLTNIKNELRLLQEQRITIEIDSGFAIAPIFEKITLSSDFRTLSLTLNESLKEYLFITTQK